MIILEINAFPMWKDKNVICRDANIFTIRFCLHLFDQFFPTFKNLSKHSANVFFFLLDRRLQ